MTIVINTLSVSGNKGGAKTYLRNITGSMVRGNPDTNFILICSKSSYPQFEFLKNSQNLDFVTLPFSTGNSLFRIFSDQVIIPLMLLLKFSKYEHVLITPSSVATIWSPIPQVLIIHAALFLKNIRNELPEGGSKLFSLWHRQYYDTFLPLSLKRCERIITVSKYLRDKTIELEPGVACKVEVIYEGVDREIFGKLPAESDKQEPYILFVSTLFPYKNAGRLIEAFGILDSEDSLPQGCRLKIIGKDPTDGVETERLGRMAEKLKLEGKVDFIGQIPHDDIVEYYKKADLFVYPSAVESFGLPPLEAMACGVPVIASNRMAIPEVVGDAALTVDPDNIDALAKSIKKLFEDQTLRSELIEKGFKQASKFSWEKAAGQLFGACMQISGSDNNE